MTILKDPVRPFVPLTQHELLEPDRGDEPRTEPPVHRPAPRPQRPGPVVEPLDDVRAAPRRSDQVGTTSFELSSRGGYVRTVTGTIAYLDEEAEAYMVLGDGDELLRVPLRDITSMREDSMNGGDRPGSRRDAEGLGTGQ